MSLGRIAERTGRADEAKQHYAQASQSDSQVGRAAALALVRLDLPANPGQYVLTRLQVDDRGMIGVAVGNNSPVALKDVQIVVGVLDPTGFRVQQAQPFELRQPLAPGTSTIVATGLGPITDPAQLQRVQVEVRNAAIAD